MWKQFTNALWFILASAMFIFSGCLLAVWAETSERRASDAPSAIVDRHEFSAVNLGQTDATHPTRQIENDRCIRLGGFSDLYRSKIDPQGEFWIVTDRGPNGEVSIDGKKRRTFPVPQFRPLILRVKAEGDGVLQVVDTLPICGQSGAGVGGFPNLAQFDGEAFEFDGQKSLPFQVNGLDCEGLIRTATGEFWVADEYRPSLVRIDASGRTLKRYIPAGQALPGADCEVIDALPAIYAKRRDNRGFEGLALSPDEKTIYAPLQSALDNPDPFAGETSRNCRILAFDRERESPSAEFVYQFDSATDFDSESSPDDMKIGAVAMIDSNRMLVLERTDRAAIVYLVDLSNATNLLTTHWHDAEGDDSLETCHDLQSVGIEALPKRLVIDLSKLDNVPPKLEGMAIVDANHLAFVNDNDFSFNGFDAAGNAVDSQRPSSLFVVRLERPLW